MIRQPTPGRAKGGVRGDRNPVVAHTAPPPVGLLPWSVSPNDHDGLEALADRAILAHREGTAVHLRPDDLIYWTGGQPGPDPHAWHAAATQHTGSWWEPWAQSMLERSGEEIPAPTALGSADHPSREPAPGTYVVERRAS